MSRRLLKLLSRKTLYGEVGAIAFLFAVITMAAYTGVMPIPAVEAGAHGETNRSGGFAWREVPRVTSNVLTDVHMVSSTDGWVVGRNATLLRYNGTAWAPFPITTRVPDEWLVDVHMISPNDG